MDKIYLVVCFLFVISVPYVSDPSVSFFAQFLIQAAFIGVGIYGYSVLREIGK